VCGIAGYIGPRELGESERLRCLEAMRHRGPDAASQYGSSDEYGLRTYLLHTRLSIIDLDPRSNQPYRLGHRVLIYNGELYNYVELRRELEDLGHRFHTSGDTEVVIHAVAEWGVDALRRADGMWALAVYNEESRELMLSRDRFGEKPLYLLPDGAGTYFGSEIKFIRALTDRRLRIHQDHIKRYLVNGYKALYKTPHEFFEKIVEVLPGTVLTVSARGERREERYWLPRAVPRPEMTFEEAADGTREILIRSLERRIRADVPLAVCLSGGIDSNAVTALAQTALGQDLHAFTIMNDDARYDEREMIDESVSALHLKHTPIPLNRGEFLPRLRRLVRQHDAPVYTLSAYAHWLLMKAVSEHGYRVVFGGVGADELFTGYFDHHLLYLAEIAGEGARFEEAAANWMRHIKPIVRNPFLQSARAFIDRPDQREHIFLGAEEFARYLTEPWAEPFAERDFGLGLLRGRMMNELFHEVVPVILHEDDLNAMSFSIENRSPFLDPKLLDWALQIPATHLVRDGAAKAVLRAAVRGYVPDAILDNRRKVGFNVPLHAFLDTRRPEVKSEILDDSPIYQLVRREKIETLMEKETLPNSESKFLFNFLCSKMFIEEFE